VPVWLRAFQAEALRLVDRLLQLVSLQDAREVELGAGGGGDGDAVVGGDLVGGENGSVKEESGSLAFVPWDGHVDAAVERPEAPQGAGRPVADNARVARVAAIHRPRRETTGWPTAYTPR
jgi:hypothetical protein